MKKICLLGGLLLAVVSLSAQNLQLRSNLSYGSSALANIGSYVDHSGNEYALVGTDFGLSIVDVTDPDNPAIRFTVPGASSIWREVKTYRDYAYVTTEGGGGLTVVDLSLLPANVNYYTYNGDGAISNQLETIHALHVDTTKGYLYLYGSNIGSGNTLFFDLSDPANPTYAGEYVYPGGGSIAYVHDGYADNDTLYESHIYSGFFTVVDVTDKSNPVLLATQVTPTEFTHNTWLSVDHKTLFTTDENSGSFLGAYDISDLSNITEKSRFQTAPGTGAIIHNTQILNDFAVNSWYKEGVVITDVSRPANPIEVGHYDTYPQGSGDGFNGCWGVDPFLPSGTVVASDIDNGLFVFTPTYLRGCYLEGRITDSITGFPLQNASIRLLTTTIAGNSDILGDYRTGTVNSGTYNIQVQKAGYQSKTITGVNLTNGVLTTLDVQLVPLPTISVSGTVTDSLSGLPIQGASVLMTDPDFTFTATTDVSGNFNLNGVLAGTYDITVGKWGYVTKCGTINAGAGAYQVALVPGYYDDFTFDFGWSVSGTSPNAWERGIPIGTYDNSGDEVNPASDVSNDCAGLCYVTDNGGGSFSNHDVDNGNTQLLSPVFDATIYSNPSIAYARWFVNTAGTGTPNDVMHIRLSNGTTTVELEQISITSPGQGTWVPHSIPLAGLIPLTPNMRLIVDIADDAPGHVLEGGLDRFAVTGQLTVGLLNGNGSEQDVTVFPNPSTTEFRIRISREQSVEALRILDLQGKTLYTASPAEISRGGFEWGSQVAPGCYFLEIQTPDGGRSFRKLVRN
jgi:choice-of-anchor B domain-containing protein